MKRTIDQLVASFASALADSTIKPKLRHFVVVAILVVVVGATITWYLQNRTQMALEAARLGLERSLVVPFERQARPARSPRGIKLIQNSRNTRDLTQFNNSYFAATEGGLVEFDPDGKLKRRYTVLDGLPESDLTCLIPFNSKLFIGTRSEGMVVFDGKRFESYLWPDRNVEAITVLLEGSGKLLIGTFAGGLLEFDGSKFKEIKAGLNQEHFKGINCLLADGARLYVGTYADGLWINEAGRWLHFTTVDGLPSNRIVGVLPYAENLFVATDFGLATSLTNQLFNAGETSSQKNFQTLATVPSLSSLTNYFGQVLCCKDGGELFRLVTDAHPASRFQLVPLTWNRPEALSFCRLIESDQKIGPQSLPRPGNQKGRALWLLSSEGIWRTSRQDERFSGGISFSSFGKTGEENSDSADPVSNLVSALALDGGGRLWAGTFRNGIDIFTAEGRKQAHLESESIREINGLVWDRETSQMLVATSQGLTRFDTSLQSQQLSKIDGLLSNSISHVALIPARNSSAAINHSRLALATSRGLSLGDAKQWRGLTTVQGLPGNSIYTVLPHREFIYAGTLNGLAQIAAGRVTRVFKDSNSKLTHNWVTSLSAIGPRLFVGTYGGGVFELTPSGEFVSFASEIGRQTVNPNAMTNDGARLYVGTLNGAWILDLRSQKWIQLKSELPSSVVLSVTSDIGHVYLGTTSGIARLEKDYLRSVKER